MNTFQNYIPDPITHKIHFDTKINYAQTVFDESEKCAHKSKNVNCEKSKNWESYSHLSKRDFYGKKLKNDYVVTQNSVPVPLDNNKDANKSSSEAYSSSKAEKHNELNSQQNKNLPQSVKSENLREFESIPAKEKNSFDATSETYKLENGEKKLEEIKNKSEKITSQNEKKEENKDYNDTQKNDKNNSYCEKRNQSQTTKVSCAECDKRNQAMKTSCPECDKRNKSTKTSCQECEKYNEKSKCQDCEKRKKYSNCKECEKRETQIIEKNNSCQECEKRKKEEECIECEKAKEKSKHIHAEEGKDGIWDKTKEMVSGGVEKAKELIAKF